MPARGAIIGINAVLSASGGSLFIPSKAGSSGTLGAPMVSGLPGSKYGKYGTSSEIITLTNVSPHAQGYVRFVLTFTLSGSATTVDSSGNARVTLKAYDLDFQETTIGKSAKLFETMDLAFMRDPAAGTSSLTPDITVDRNNYGTYRSGGFALAGTNVTNNASGTYTFNLMNALGVDTADLTSINSTHKFGIFVTLRSDLTKITAGTKRYLNTVEKFEQTSFDYNPQVVPEPATALLLACGAVAAIGRRRRRRM